MTENLWVRTKAGDYRAVIGPTLQAFVSRERSKAKGKLPWWGIVTRAGVKTHFGGASLKGAKARAERIMFLNTDY